MNVRRVRLLDGPDPRQTDLTLRAPRARRTRGTFDAVRVRSVWLRSEEGEVRTGWGGGPPQGGRDGEGRSRAPATVPAPPPAEDFLLKLRELLRPGVQALLKRCEWPAPLYPFQEQGVLFLYGRSGALLADEPGLGKTIQSLVAAGLLFSTGQIEQAIVLCPAALVPNWLREARRWLPRLGDGIRALAGTPLQRHYLWHSRLPLLVAGYETFRSDYLAGRLPERPRDLVILDEAQRIKNAGTDLAVACKSLPRKRSWALTGTPLENSLEDLLSILEWVTGGPVPGLGALPALREQQQALQLRRKKEAVALELPPKTAVNVLLEMGPAQRESYRRLEREGLLRLRARGESIRVTHVLALLTRLKQVCNFCPETGESVKLQALRDQLDEILASGRQALVFSQFTDDHAGLRRVAAALEGRMALFHGGMSPSARERAVQAFNDGESRVLGLSLRAGGVGLNLQRASYVFHFDRWWNPAVEWQAEDRAHRLGQALPVTVYRLVTTGTIEEKIHALLESKEALFQDVVEGAPAPAAARVTLDELFGLFDLPVPAALGDDAVPDAES